MTDLDKATAYNPCLVGSTSPYEDGEHFLKDLADGVSIADLMVRYPFPRSIRQRLYEMLGSLKRRILRK